MNPPAPTARWGGRLTIHDIKPDPTPGELAVLTEALELALKTDAKGVPDSAWSSARYLDGGSLRHGQRIWTASAESEAPKQPGYPHPRRSG